MFGYVKIHKPELKFKDYEIYRGVYCSLCKALGKEYSVFARFILNYDCTFLSLMLLSREKTCCGFTNGRCRFNPLKKCNYIKGGKDALSKGAALTIITSYYKLLDSIEDSSVFKKIGCTLIRPFFSGWHKKAMKRFPAYEKAVREMFFSQLEYEKRDDVCLDMAAEPTAKMLCDVFKEEAKNEAEEKVFAQFGYHLGRWVYLMDAAADMEEDRKNGNFNPFLLSKDSDEETIKRADSVLSQSYYLLTKAYELIDKERFSDVLDNVIYCGLAIMQNNTLYPRKEKCNE